MNSAGRAELGGRVGEQRQERDAHQQEQDA
jgi:hypothetical protein